MKMAKANEADLNMAMELSNALDALTNRWSPAMPEGAATDCDDEEIEHFNIDNKDQCKRALEYLLSLANRASLMRVVWGCAVMLDPENELVDPNADTIEHHPKRQMLEQQRDRLLEVLRSVLVEGKHLALVSSNLLAAINKEDGAKEARDIERDGWEVELSKAQELRSEYWNAVSCAQYEYEKRDARARALISEVEAQT